MKRKCINLVSLFVWGFAMLCAHHTAHAGGSVTNNGNVAITVTVTSFGYESTYTQETTESWWYDETDSTFTSSSTFTPISETETVTIEPGDTLVVDDIEEHTEEHTYEEAEVPGVGGYRKWGLTAKDKSVSKSISG